MRIGILIFSKPKNAESANPDRFEEAGRALGHEIVRIHEPSLTISSELEVNEKMRVRILSDQTEYGQTDFDVIICRPNFTEEPGLHLYTVQTLKNAGFRVVNASAMLAQAKNKLEQHIRLAEVGVPMPRWAIAHTPDAIVAAAEKIGFPVVAKVAFGTHGKGVFYAPTIETLSPIVDYLAVRDGNPVIVEEFIAEAEHKDLRAFVLGGKVIASMERVARPGDIRANAALGGEGRQVSLTDEEQQLAIQAAAAFDLEIAGVDILRSHRGPLVIEVNANPGFKELENTTGKDVAKAILEYAKKKITN